VLTAITRGDYGIMTFIQGLDASGQPLVIPALAIVGASLDLRSDDTEAILHGLERLESVMIAPCGTPSRPSGWPPSSPGPGSARGTLMWLRSPTRRSAPSSRSMRPGGGTMQRTSTSRCTSSRSPTPMRRRVAPGQGR
jgi:hypothetical protein